MKNPTLVESFLKRDLYFRWVFDALLNIKQIVVDLEFDKVGVFDAASKSTKPLFEEKIDRIGYELMHKPAGIYPSIDEIFKREVTSSSSDAVVLDLVKNVKLLADDINKCKWRILHPKIYILLDRRIIALLLIGFLCALPLWYFFGVHRTSANNPALILNSDIQHVVAITQAQNTSLLDKAILLIRFIWEFTLAVPSLFLLPAAVLAIVRSKLIHQSKTVGRYEKLFGDIGRELQKVVPNPQKWPSVRIKMTNSIYNASGTNITQILNSTVTNSFNKIEEVYGSSATAFLKEVASTVENSGDINAADHYASLVDNLKNKRRVWLVQCGTGWSRFCRLSKKSQALPRLFRSCLGRRVISHFQTGGPLRLERRRSARASAGDLPPANWIVFG